MDILKMLGVLLEADTDEANEETPPSDTTTSEEETPPEETTGETSTSDDEPLGETDTNPEDEVEETTDETNTNKEETPASEEGETTDDNEEGEGEEDEDDESNQLTDDEIQEIDKTEVLFDRRVKTLNETVLTSYDVMFNFNTYLQTVDKLDEDKEFVMADLKTKYNDMFRLYKIYVEEVFSVNDFHINMLTYRKFKITAEILHNSIRELLSVE